MVYNMRILMFLLCAVICSNSLADDASVLDKAMNFFDINLTKSDTPPALAKELSTLSVYERIAGNISSSTFQASLRHSGPVSISIRPINDEFSFFNETKPIIRVAAFIDVENVDVSYSEKVYWTASVKPYFDYTQDMVGLYPDSDAQVLPVNDNGFIRGELEGRVYAIIEDTLLNAVKTAYIEDITNEEKELVESNISELTFAVNMKEGVFSIVLNDQLAVNY